MRTSKCQYLGAGVICEPWFTGSPEICELRKNVNLNSKFTGKMGELGSQKLSSQNFVSQKLGSRTLFVKKNFAQEHVNQTYANLTFVNQKNSLYQC